MLLFMTKHRTKVNDQSNDKLWHNLLHNRVNMDVRENSIIRPKSICREIR